MKKILLVLCSIALGFVFVPCPANAAAIIDLQVEGGGTQQVYQLGSGNYLGLWGFDARYAGITSNVTITSAADILGGFTSGAASIVNFYNGTNPVNAGASEFDPLTYSFIVTDGARLYDSLWIEWTGGNLVYGKLNGGTSTMNSTNVTRLGDPFAPVPEPGTLILLGSGLLGLVVAGRNKFRK